MQESEEIMAKTSKFENTLMDIADFVDSNVYLRSIPTMHSRFLTNMALR